MLSWCTAIRAKDAQAPQSVRCCCLWVLRSRSMTAWSSMDTSDLFAVKVSVSRASCAICTTLKAITKNRSSHPLLRDCERFNSTKFRKWLLAAAFLALMSTTVKGLTSREFSVFLPPRSTDRKTAPFIWWCPSSNDSRLRCAETQKLSSNTMGLRIKWSAASCSTQPSFKMATTFVQARCSWVLRTFERTRGKYWIANLRSTFFSMIFALIAVRIEPKSRTSVRSAWKF